MNNYIIKYLYENTDYDKNLINYFKNELDWHFYDYGDHLNKGHRRGSIKLLNAILKYIYMLMNYKYILNNNILSTSNSYLNEEFKKHNYNVITTIFNFNKNTNYLKEINIIDYAKFLEITRKKEFIKILKDKNIEREIRKLQNKVDRSIDKYEIKALFTQTDEDFISKILIDKFKERLVPTFINSHGLPSIYSKDLDNRSDYLMVWGNKIKENYINAGFDKEKIIITGHPKYKNIKEKSDIKFSMENILIIPESSVIWHQHTFNNNPIIIDRSRMILYLYKVKNVLDKFNIKNVRVRLHPSVNKNWVKKFIDPEYFIIDYLDLEKSLNTSSIIIGATSTVFLESLYYSKNYIIFEMQEKQNLYQPFTSENSKIAFADNEDDLYFLLKNKYVTKYEIIHDYISQFNLDLIKKIIE